ncbi:MAG: NAD(P)/FAD-dependent oxidoreductase [Pseudomarimonas sp.]
MAAQTHVTEVAVLGAGLVGLACAHHLRQRGHGVLLIDPRGPGGETSFGNAGSISVGNVMPQSSPGIVLKALRMLADPLAPLKLDQPQRPGYWRWLWEFVRHGQSERVLPIIDALHAINHASRQAWLDWAAAIDADELLATSGYLQVYEHEKTFNAGAFERAQMLRLGVRHEVLDRAGIAELEPQLGAGFNVATFQPAALAMRDPGGFCQRAANHLATQQVSLLPLSVNTILQAPHGYRLRADAGVIDCEKLVVCAGAWSARLLAGFKLQLPIVPARGYHLMFNARPAPVQRPTLWAERYMVVTPMVSGVRMTSIKELTRLDSDPHYPLIHRLRPELARLFPSIQGDPISQWAGYRPCTPDSLPIIDRLPGEAIYLAAGHGHLGLTQSAVTGRLISEMIGGAARSLDVRPYRLQRLTS